ncbi:hypothetical protein [Sinorhizobium meliloti]|uniref:hypothetical protein n=1 Tax=Rhizobium meliloti TaxID=382 RepID=UPI000FDA87BC|nr:hypothetical protein [Sinorhizobium meliloti]RVG88671.1 hypothetical protein CN219_03630 [Sinorhizobium meliloti]RVI39047.1 hypothetical protein CN197_02605 [Sinorhizobium meliloti]RVI46682.1 hypothetical protein CN196_09455 [Sinorhizobium meliloti]RVJ25684.1 hypothetical protein CN177_13495 [Sinorhizobium meliloti]RVK02237.1 hypothetical protein CN170_08635 [Sinorhizobium meliloti]
MATKLQVWKQALIHLELASISTLTDDVEAVNVFGNAWDGTVLECFNSGDWNAFKKSVALSQNNTETASVGWSYVFDYPDDYLRTIAVSSIPRFDDPFGDFVDEGGFLHANTTSIYLRYISDDKVAVVEDWPTMFWRYVALQLAVDTVGKLTNGTTLYQKLEAERDVAWRKAKSIDARNENHKRVSTGSWLRSRLGGYGSLGDNRGGTLVGGQITFDEGDV